MTLCGSQSRAIVLKLLSVTWRHTSLTTAHARIPRRSDSDWLKRDLFLLGESGIAVFGPELSDFSL